MPVMDGYETASLIRLRRESELTPVIFITAYTRDEAQVPLAYASGAVDFIFGPIVPDVLRAKVAFFTELFFKSRDLEVSLQAATQLSEQFRLSEARTRVALEDSTDTEAVLRRASRHFELSRDLVCTASFDGQLKQVNAVWTTVLGWEPEELCSRPLTDFVHPDDCVATQAEWAGLANATTTASFTNRYRTKDGGWRWIEWTAGVAPDEDLIYASVRDVSERKRDELRLEETASALEHSNQDLQKFASVASHELSEPLRTIAGFGQLLQKRYGEKLDERGMEYIARMVGGVGRMQLLLRDLRDFSAGREDLFFWDDVDVGELVGHVVDDLHTAIAESEAEVEVGEMPQLSANSEQLGQLFQNLIANAIKFSNGGPPQVKVTSERVGGGWTFLVADAGIGIPEHQHERIFDVFQRLHGREEYAGTGVGLAICRRIVRRHGGEISVEAGIHGGGTGFRFDLPDAGFDLPNAGTSLAPA
jgi:PAS domain S-box-containing protein